MFKFMPIVVLIAACRQSSSSAADLGVAADLTVASDLAVTSDLSAADSDAAVPLEQIACGPLTSGAPWSSGVVENDPDYANELAALDLSSAPEPIDLSTSSKLAQAVVGYMLEKPGVMTLGRDETLALGNLGRAVVGSIVVGGGKVDLPFLRKGLQYFDRCTQQPPATLEALRARFGDYATWPTSEVACSRPKNGPRRLYTNDSAGVYIAETIVDGGVRETEMLRTSARGDGQLAFAAYAADGQLSDRSSFATNGGGVATSGVPYTCMTCHLDTTSYTFTRQLPTGTGAGCK